MFHRIGRTFCIFHCYMTPYSYLCPVPFNTIQANESHASTENISMMYSPLNLIWRLMSFSWKKKDKYENNVKFITWVTWKRIDKWHYAEDISGPGRAHYSGDRVFIYLNMKNEFIRCIIIMYHLITGWVTNIVSQGKILILFYNFFFPHIWDGWPFLIIWAHDFRWS